MRPIGPSPFEINRNRERINRLRELSRRDRELSRREETQDRELSNRMETSRTQELSEINYPTNCKNKEDLLGEEYVKIKSVATIKREDVVYCFSCYDLSGQLNKNDIHISYGHGKLQITDEEKIIYSIFTITTNARKRTKKSFLEANLELPLRKTLSLLFNNLVS